MARSGEYELRMAYPRNGETLTELRRLIYENPVAVYEIKTNSSSKLVRHSDVDGAAGRGWAAR